MVIAALACVLVPMLRSARRNGRPRAPFFLALALALVLPPAAFGLYTLLGTPQALQAPPDSPADLATATAQLRATLARKPDDAQGWALLAQAYSALDEPAQARAALDHLLELKPDDADAMVAWVEASAEMRPDHVIDDASRARLERALQIDPAHQRALWLLGISDFQRGKYGGAAQTWRRLLPLLPPGSKVANAVQQELAVAQARAGSTGTPSIASATPPVAATADAAAGRIALTVDVSLDPRLAAKIRPGDTLFVFARAIDGPPMPLAVAKLSAASLPARVTLTDAMAMSPQLKLSDFPRVQIAARISRSGDALPHPGDLEAPPVQVATDTRTPVALTIDRAD